MSRGIVRRGLECCEHDEVVAGLAELSVVLCQALLMWGGLLHVLQDILGHASMETTCGYLHPDDRHLASAAEQANAFLSAAGQRKHARRSSPATRSL